LPLARVLALCAALLLACSLLVAPVRAALAQDESATEEASGDGAANFTDPQNGAEGGEEEQTPDEEDGGGVLDKVGGFLKDVALAPGKAAGDLAASGIEAVGVKTFLTLLEMFINDVLLAGIEQASEALTRSAFSLPPPEGKLVQEYDKLMELVRPAVLIGILLLGGLMMAQSANYNAAYAAQYGLPKLFFVALTLVFFPDFMTFVSDVSGSLSEGMMSQADVGGALKNLLAKTVTGNLTGMGILMFFAWIAIFCMIFLVMAVAILKNILFALLFILGPLAIISYPIPGLSAVAGAWFRGIMACALIPLAFTMEIMVGSWIIESPELVFGPAGEILPIFTALAVVILLWIMWKTPFSVMGWAFQSASVSGLSGTLNPVAAAGRGARSAAGVAASIGKSVAVRRIAGGPAGGASAKGAPLAKGADLDKGAPGRPSGQRPGPSQARFNRSQRNATARQVTTAVKNVATLNNLRGGGGPSGTGASGGTSRPNNAFPTRASASRSGGGRKPNSGPAGDAGSRGAKRAGPTKD
jgi:hypothetical protein